MHHLLEASFELLFGLHEQDWWMFGLYFQTLADLFCKQVKNLELSYSITALAAF